MLASSSLLKTAFFNRDPRLVARALLGKLLVRKTPRGNVVGRIVETEAYLSTDDAAAHSASGKTARNFVLFGPPGIAYVYFVYGNHYCLNVSCLPDGVAGGVLFRALEPVEGMKKMATARGIEPVNEVALSTLAFLKKLTSGPGRLAEALGVTRKRDNEKNFASPRSDLQILDDGYHVRRITVTPRIGIVKAAGHPLRYLIDGNEFVSGSRTMLSIKRVPPT